MTDKKIKIEKTWNATDAEQAMGRADRNTQQSRTFDGLYGKVNKARHDLMARMAQSGLTPTGRFSRPPEMQDLPRVKDTRPEVVIHTSMGHGKSQAMNHLLQEAMERGERVVVLARHQPLDLPQGVEFVRLPERTTVGHDFEQMRRMHDRLKKLAEDSGKKVNVVMWPTAN